MWSMIKNWWKTATMSAEEKYLGQSVDWVDFESRLRDIDQKFGYSKYGQFLKRL